MSQQPPGPWDARRPGTPQYSPTDETRIGPPPAPSGPGGWGYGPQGQVPPGQYPPTTYPPAAYPPGGYPAGGYAPVPPPRGTNGFAIAALIFGILGVLGALFGFIALSQIRRTGQSGRGLAIAGIVLSGIWAAIIVVGVVLAIVNSASRDDTGTITDGGSVSATALQVGDCLVDLPDGTSVNSLDAVPCSTPHEGEVFAVFDLADGPYPGDTTVQTQVESECNTRLNNYAPSTIGDTSIGLYFVYPLEANWDIDDREVVCIATALSGTTTGSITD